MLEKIKRINLSKKKIFVVGIVIGITLLIGGSLVLSESAFPKKVINMLKYKDVGIIMKEVKEETPVREPCKDPKCEEEVNMAKSCGGLLDDLDPNERSPEICQAYWEASELVVKGKDDEAKALLEEAIVRFPESRNLHKLLAEALWYIYDEKDPSTLPMLEQAIKEAEQALDIGLSFGTVDNELENLLLKVVVELKDVQTLDRIFEKIFRIELSAHTYGGYAWALSKMNDPRTEEAFKKLMELEGSEYFAPSSYAEWLLDQNRENDVLLLSTKKDSYMFFYRAVALERLNRLNEAKEEYAKFRDEYIRDRKKDFLPPMPKRFQIPGSKLQKEMKIRFEGDESSTRIQATTAISDEQAINGLSYLIWGEAQGETYGGMRAVGWIVRSRALRGSIGPSSCRLYVNNTGSTLTDQYKSVMCQSKQFEGMCLDWCSDPNTMACIPTKPEDKKRYEEFALPTASWVYNGYDPDPITGHCPGGITYWGGSYCADSTDCKGYKDTYKLAGPVLNYGTSGNCPSTHSALTCGPNGVGKTCGNGGRDNCFYPYPIYCVGSGCVIYSGSLGSGQCGVTAYFYSSVTGYHKGHLEGPEGNYNLIDFDLYFQKWVNNGWQTVASSIRYGSVDDIKYPGTAGYYRWRICAYRGTGSLRLYTSRPQ